MPKPLKLNGRIFSLHPPSPTQTKVQQFLDKSPADELYSSSGLAKVMSLGIRSVGYLGNEDALKPYTHKQGAVRFWGNPKAIIALRQQIEAGE